MDDTRHSGFTLIELLVVVAIAGLLAGLAVPAMGRYIDSTRLRGAAETLFQELQQARNHALNFQQPVYFSFSSPSGGDWCYGWTIGAHCDCRRPGVCANRSPRHSGRQVAADFPSVTLLTPASVSQQNLHFSAVRATASAGSVGLQNAAGVVRAIISPLGRIRLCSPTGSLYPHC